MKKYAGIVMIACISILSCRTLAVDPYRQHHHQNKQVTHRECLDDCKGLKGQERARCNRNCNQKYR